MKHIKTLTVSLLAISTLATTGVVSPVRADTVDARCDVFPRGEDKATSSGLCTFSQRQGFVSIQLKDGTRYELKPNASTPNSYLDAKGEPARREILESNRGQVYRLARQSIFVFWDPAPYGKGAPQSSTGSTSSAGSSTVSGTSPEFWVVTAATTFLKASPGIFSKTVTNTLTSGTVLRNLGCQSQRTPTWCQVEQRDNPQLKGWVWSANVKEFSAGGPGAATVPSAAPAVGSPVARLSDLVGSRAGQAESTIEQRGYRFVRTETSGDAKYSYWQEAKTKNCVVIRTADGRYESIVYGGAKCN